VKLLFRYDDYSEIGNTTLDLAILEIIAEEGFTSLVGVIPAIADVNWALGDTIPLRRLSRERIGKLKVLVPCAAGIALHGYTHQAVTRLSGLFEFGDVVDISRQEERLRDGKHFLEDSFGVAVDWFIPPWNAYGVTTLNALAACGFKGISGDAYFGPLADGISYAPYSCLPRELSLACARARPVDNSAVIVMLHDYDFEESGFDVGVFTLAKFRTLLQMLRQSGVTAGNFSQLHADPAFGPTRAAGNQRLRKSAGSPARFLMKRGMTCVYWDDLCAETLSHRMESLDRISEIPRRLYRSLRK